MFSFSTFNIPHQICLLITDQLSSSADFVLQQFVKEASINSTDVIVLSVVSWSIAAVKAFPNITFVQCTDDSLQLLALRTIYDRLNEALKNLTAGPHILIILDDISTFEWTGHASVLEISRFVRAIRALCLTYKATLVIRHHNAPQDDIDGDVILRPLLEMSSYHMEVRELGSGRSGAVSGEIALHAGPMANILVDKDIKLLSRSAAMQYRLTDAGAVYFDRGNSSGVL